MFNYLFGFFRIDLCTMLILVSQFPFVIPFDSFKVLLKGNEIHWKYAETLDKIRVVTSGRLF
jgi:hypothetical protein